MPIFRLTDEIVFPDPCLAEEDGLLAVGGDLSIERLLTAYSLGIFPWYEDGLPILWHSPNPRFVLYPAEFRTNRSLRKTMRRFLITFDSLFEQVISNCADIRRRGQHSTWITKEQKSAFIELHRMGFAHSVEARNQDGLLVGGLYGVSLGAAFFGESMFHLESGASKAALAALVHKVQSWGFAFIDCQVHTPLLESLGARHIPRECFMDELEDALVKSPTHRGSWGDND